MKNHKKHIEQDKHVNDPNSDKTVLAHVEENGKLPFFQFFCFSSFFFQNKGLVSNAQVNSNIRKRQLPGNGAKNLLGRIQALKFINPKCKVHRCVLGVSSAGSCVLSIEINYGGSS